jgi:hypothetical protein
VRNLDHDGAILEMTVDVRDKKQLEKLAAAMRRISGAVSMASPILRDKCPCASCTGAHGSPLASPNRPIFVRCSSPL